MSKRYVDVEFTPKFSPCKTVVGTITIEDVEVPENDNGDITADEVHGAIWKLLTNDLRITVECHRVKGRVEEASDE